jgi:hypothetical protein
MPRWTPELRQRQAEKIRKWQPWEWSTGPKTAGGKSASSQNARKHGYRSQEFRDLHKAIRTTGEQMIESGGDPLDILDTLGKFIEKSTI